MANSIPISKQDYIGVTRKKNIRCSRNALNVDYTPININYLIFKKWPKVKRPCKKIKLCIR
jgi:hypothetical protein